MGQALVTKTITSFRRTCLSFVLGQIFTLSLYKKFQKETKAYSLKVDIFALGLIFFELFYSLGTVMEKEKVRAKNADTFSWSLLIDYSVIKAKTD